MAVHVALLRGINVGAHNRVAMPALREHLAELGYGNVRTLLQSGNIVLESQAKPAQLERDLQRAIAARFAVDTPVVVRSAKALAAVVADNPIPDGAGDPKRFQVFFLSDRCPADEATAIAAGDFGDEQVVVHGREVYAWHVDGVQSSPLAKRLGQLSVSATARNWNTIGKLLELAAVG